MISLSHSWIPDDKDSYGGLLLHRMSGTRGVFICCAEREVKVISESPYPGPEGRTELLEQDEEVGAGPNFSKFLEFPERWAHL